MSEILKRKEHLLVAVGLTAAGIGLVACIISFVLVFTRSQDSPETPAEAYIREFETGETSEQRLNGLAALFELGVVNPTYTEKAHQLFAGLPPEKKLALFELSSPPEVATSLLTVVQNIYFGLENTPFDNNVLRVIALSLNETNQRAAIQTASEIEAWLKGREYLAQENYVAARDAYSAAIFLNNQNPMTHYERALVLVALKEYDKALLDYAEAIQLHETLPLDVPATVSALREITPTATPIPTTTPSPGSITTPSSLLSSSPTPTETTTPPSTHTPQPSTSIPTQTQVPSATPPTHTATPTLEPKLVLTKQAPTEIDPGDTIAYTLILKNEGDGPARNITIKDQLVTQIIDPENINLGGIVEGSHVVWQLAQLAGQDSQTFTWQGTVDPLVPANLSEVISAASFEDDQGHSGEIETRTSLRSQSITLEMSAPSVVWPGRSYVYTLHVENNGKANLNEIEVRNPLPFFIINPTGISSGGSLETNADIVWRLDSLDAGEIETLTWKGVVDPNIPTSATEIRNRATLNTGGGLTREEEVTSLVIPEALTLTVSATEQAAPGEGVAYLLAVKNTSPEQANNIEIRNPVPEHLTNPSAISGGGIILNNEIIWTLNNLNAGATRNLSWAGIIDPTMPATIKEIANQATAKRSDSLPIMAQDITSLLHPSILLTKEGPGIIDPGNIVTYTMQVTNTGDIVLQEVVVTDPVPTFVLAPTNISGNGNLANSTITWPVGSLGPGETMLLSWQGTIDSTVSPGTIIANLAVVTTMSGIEDEAEVATLVN